MRTAAVNEEDFNAPLPGLIVTYRFHFDDVLSAFHVSVSFGSDMLINGCTVKLMDITTEGMKITSYTGYEFDAQGNPYCKTFSMPEENPDTPSYEELQHMAPHSFWEKMKTRPQTFRDAHDHRGDDYRFESEAVPATAKDLNGNIVQKSYASTEPNGVLTKFARMCPTTTVWKNEIRQVIRKLYTNYGVDGIDLDVVSAAYEHCCDETHLHEPGHGHF